MNFDNDKRPPLILLTTFLPKQDIITLYKMCDCFVFPTRAEGFGLPLMEAMLCNKPVITTNYGGHLDFCCEDYKGSNYFTSNAFNKPLCTLLPYQLTPVAHMQWIPYYDGTQSWAEPDVMNLKEHMRYVYYGMYLHDTVKAQKHIEQNYNYKTVAQKIMEILKKYKRC
jgi:glycosyltransferase involved in cell wall biosynthesis